MSYVVVAVVSLVVGVIAGYHYRAKLAVVSAGVDKAKADAEKIKEVVSK